MQRVYLKPKMVTPPGGDPVLAKLEHPTSGLVLRPAGGWVPYLGREGNWWRRRVAEGSAEIVKPPEPKAAEEPPEPKAAEAPAEAPAEDPTERFALTEGTTTDDTDTELAEADAESDTSEG